jgi:hypothetical protein
MGNGNMANNAMDNEMEVDNTMSQTQGATQQAGEAVDDELKWPETAVGKVVVLRSERMSGWNIYY